MKQYLHAMGWKDTILLFRHPNKLQTVFFVFLTGLMGLFQANIDT
jgi:hypothetical protein